MASSAALRKTSLQVPNLSPLSGGDQSSSPGGQGPGDDGEDGGDDDYGFTGRQAVKYQSHAVVMDSPRPADGDGDGGKTADGDEEGGERGGALQQAETHHRVATKGELVAEIMLQCSGPSPDPLRVVVGTLVTFKSDEPLGIEFQLKVYPPAGQSVESECFGGPKQAWEYLSTSPGTITYRDTDFAECSGTIEVLEPRSPEERRMAAEALAAATEERRERQARDVAERDCDTQVTAGAGLPGDEATGGEDYALGSGRGGGAVRLARGGGGGGGGGDDGLDEERQWAVAESLRIYNEQKQKRLAQSRQKK